MNEILNLEQVLTIFKDAGITKSKEMIRRWAREQKLTAIVPAAKWQGLSFRKCDVDEFILNYVKELDSKRNKAMPKEEIVDNEKQQLIEEIQRLKGEIFKLQSQKETEEINNLGESTLSVDIVGDKSTIMEFLKTTNGSDKFHAQMHSNRRHEKSEWANLVIDLVDKKEIVLKKDEMDLIDIGIVNVSVRDVYDIEITFRSKKKNMKDIDFVCRFEYERWAEKYKAASITFSIDERKYFMLPQTGRELEKILLHKRVQKATYGAMIKELKRINKYSDIAKKLEI
ncbi:hypothetical protein COA01_23190 [Bacillus cereus]|uniref:hypothetical protein n=1 Tax=Bacillus cereus TaxID=1396 RepID=UPI000BFDD52D|nr:hypothetical protein [Bacillus cereus]PGP18650.1 hypothetical protein COA01_23190 [Bacillus cereus]